MIWTLNSTHSCRKIGSVTIVRIFRSFSRSKTSLTITWIWENHRFQCLICKKTFNGDGPGMVKPLKNHWWQWCLGKKKHYHLIVIKKWPSSKSSEWQGHLLSCSGQLKTLEQNCTVLKVHNNNKKSISEQRQPEALLLSKRHISVIWDLTCFAKFGKSTFNSTLQGTLP